VKSPINLAPKAPGSTFRPEDQEKTRAKIVVANSCRTISDLITSEIEKTLSSNEPLTSSTSTKSSPFGVLPGKHTIHHSQQPQISSIHRMTQIIEDSILGGHTKPTVVRGHPGSDGLEGLACPRTKSPTLRLFSLKQLFRFDLIYLLCTGLLQSLFLINLNPKCPRISCRRDVEVLNQLKMLDIFRESVHLPKMCLKRVYLILQRSTTLNHVIQHPHIKNLSRVQLWANVILLLQELESVTVNRQIKIYITVHVPTWIISVGNPSTPLLALKTHKGAITKTYWLKDLSLALLQREASFIRTYNKALALQGMPIWIPAAHSPPAILMSHKIFQQMQTRIELCLQKVCFEHLSTSNVQP